MEPIVRIVAATQFFSVPEELLPEGASEIIHMDRCQDKGTDSERLIECAARNCYDSYGRGRSSADHHQHIKEVGHGSVTEHAYISFYFDNLDRGLTHELVRHRHANISQRSTRYVDESESEWVWHPLIADMLANLDSKEFHNKVNEIRGRIGGVERQARQLYQLLVWEISTYLKEEKGTDLITARKQARGAARGALGNALKTSMVWTVNVRSFRNFLEQRASPFADAAIRRLACRAYEAAYPIWPRYLDDYTRVECPDGIEYGLVTKYPKI